MLHLLPAFKWLTPEQYKADFEPFLTYRRYPPDSKVMIDGQLMSHLLVIISGAVKLVSERSVTFNFIGPGAMLGEGLLLRNEPARLSGITSMETMLCEMTRSRYLHLMDTCAPFGRTVAMDLAMKLHYCHHRVKLLTSSTLKDRILEVLLGVAQREGVGQVGVRRFSQVDLAGMCGVSRERVNKALSELIDSGLLFKTGRVFRLTLSER